MREIKPFIQYSFDSLMDKSKSFSIRKRVNELFATYLVGPLATSETKIDGQIGTDCIIVPNPEGQNISPGVSPQVIVGRDNRTSITDTRVYPYSTICQIISTFPDGTITGGS